MLNIDLATILFELFNFILLSVLLYRFLFKPVMARVKLRAAEKERLQQMLTQETADMAQERELLHERLAVLDEEKEGILAEVSAQAGENAAAVLAQAQQEAETIRRQARAEAGQWRREAIRRFEDDLVETVIHVGSQLVGQVAPAELHRRLVDELVHELVELGRHNMPRVNEVRHSLADRQPTVLVKTAQPVDPDQQRLLLTTLAALADREIHLELELAAELAAGLRVRMGDLVIDHSIAGQMESLRDQVVADLGQTLQPEGESDD